MVLLLVRLWVYGSLPGMPGDLPWTIFLLSEAAAEALLLVLEVRMA